MSPSSVPVTLRPLPSGYGEERLAIWLGDQYAGGITLHSIDRAQGVFSYGIAVARPLRRQGVALRAVRALLARCAAQGFALCAVEVYADNAPSLALHAKLGFTPVCRFQKDRREAVRLEYRLLP